MRTKVEIEGQPGNYRWICEEGYVWNQPAHGTRWKHQVKVTGEIGRWAYDAGQGTYLVKVYEQTVAKPPVGLRPDYIAVAEYDRSRCKEIGEAILRYATALQPVPQAWIDELNELIERNQPKDPEV